MQLDHFRVFTLLHEAISKNIIVTRIFCTTNLPLNQHPFVGNNLRFSVVAISYQSISEMYVCSHPLFVCYRQVLHFLHCFFSQPYLHLSCVLLEACRAPILRHAFCYFILMTCCHEHARQVCTASITRHAYSGASTPHHRCRH